MMLKTSRSNTCITNVSDIHVMADIGVFSHEIGVKQPLVIDVSILLKAPLQDRLDHTYDYNKVANILDKLCEERTVLIETFAHKLAEMCMQDTLVIGVEVSVKKPKALRNGLANCVVQMSKPQGDVY